VAVLRTAKGSARQSRRLWRALPFVVCAAAGLATLAFPPYHHETGHLVVAGLLTVVCVLLACRPAESSASLMAAPACFFLVVAVLRDGSGGSDSGLAPLVVLPILWVALNGRRLEMFLAAGLTALLFMVPLVLVGQPEYDASDWRRAALYTLIAAVIGPVVQGVVRRLEAGEREALEARAYADGILAAATEHSIIATDLDGLIVTFNAGAERMLGYTAEEMIGKQSPVILHDHDEVVARAAELGIEPGLEVFVREARRGRTETREWTFIAKDGHRVPVRLSLSGIKDANGQVTGFMGLARDISGWKQALSELAAAEARWRVLFDHLPDTAVLVVNDELRYVATAGAGLAERGYTDITERRQLERRLAHLADHDPLTGLANRRRFDADLERHLELCGRYGPRGALLMLDLDHFKEVNDTLGHGAGDELIESVTALLEQRMRKSDTVARFGGDEFVVLLPEADRVAAEQVATDIVELVRERAEFADGTRPLRISASVGVVLIDRADVTAERLMSTVDVTMYDAKESGRDRWVLNRLPQIEPRVI